MIPNFKAWHKKKKRWEDPSDVRIDGNGLVWIKLCTELTLGTPPKTEKSYEWVARHPNDIDTSLTTVYDILWSTGRKDIDGKEIFQDDLVESVGEGGGLARVHQAGSGEWLIHWLDKELDFSESLVVWKVKIVGNVQENPERLEEME